MNNKFNGKHLSLEDRKMIEEGIEKGLRKFEIAKSINKSPPKFLTLETHPYKVTTSPKLSRLILVFSIFINPP